MPALDERLGSNNSFACFPMFWSWTKSKGILRRLPSTSKESHRYLAFCWYNFIPFLICPDFIVRHSSLFGMGKPALMKVAVADRRATRRHSFKAPLRIRIGKSAIPEQRAESENLSEKGIFFATDSFLRLGTTVEILLKMPEEITGEPTTEWMRTGHVVRDEPSNFSRGKPGVGVQFDCYQIYGLEGLAVSGEEDGDSTSCTDH